MKLEGVRVLDLGLFLPGPLLSQTMADHGADVVKLEPPGEGDPGRHIGVAEQGHSVFFRNLNRGKRSLSLNLKSPAGRAALLRVAGTMDVFIEAFRPGVVERLGCSYETLRAHNPGLVYCSISAFGQDGPYRDRPAHDLVCEAYAGLVSLNVAADGQPNLPPVPVADLSAALHALAGIVMALYRREKTGLGDRLDISMHDCALASLPNVLGPVFAEKRDLVARNERSLGGAAFYQVYRTRDDRHVVLGAQEPKFVRALLTEWGRPDLIELCLRGPGEHQRPVIDFVQSVFATRTQTEWMAWFEGRDIGFGPVKTLREAFDDPHANARRMHPIDAAGREHVGAPIQFGAEPAQLKFEWPGVGQQTRDILREAGYADPEIGELEAQGAFSAAGRVDGVAAR